MTDQYVEYIRGTSTNLTDIKLLSQLAGLNLKSVTLFGETDPPPQLLHLLGIVTLLVEKTNIDNRRSSYTYKITVSPDGTYLQVIKEHSIKDAKLILATFKTIK